MCLIHLSLLTRSCEIVLGSEERRCRGYDAREHHRKQAFYDLFRQATNHLLEMGTLTALGSQNVLLYGNASAARVFVSAVDDVFRHLLFAKVTKATNIIRAG